MMTFFGISAIICATSFFGFMKVADLYAREKKLSLVIYMLQEMEILLKYKAYVVYDLIKELLKNSDIKNLEFLHYIKDDDISFSDRWKKSVEMYEIELNKEDKRILASIGEGLGNSDLDGQIATINLFKENFTRRKEKAVEKRDKNSKLYGSLGVLTGIFISILII